MPDIVRYAGVPALYEAEEQKQDNQIGFVREQAPVEDGLSSVPATRRLLFPPVVTSHRKFQAALSAMSQLSMSPKEAGLVGKGGLACLRVSFDGSESIVVEGANRAEHGVVRVKAKCRQPSAAWSVLVPADNVVQTVASLPNQPLELAPGERLYLAGLSVQILEGEFPARPVIPPDVDDGELKEIGFQAVVSKNDLKSALAFCVPIIRTESQRVNLQNLLFHPERKLGGGTDGERANMLKLDVRAKARLTHPAPFAMTLSAARAATIVDEDDFVFLSMTTGSELIVAGRKAQTYSIVINRRIQTGLPFLFFDFWPAESSEFVVKHRDLVTFCEKACDVFRGTEGDGAARLYFGERFLRAEAVQREIGMERDDIDLEIPYVRTKQLNIVDRRMYCNPGWLLGLLNMNKGEEVTLLLPRNSKSSDRITIQGSDPTRVSIISPINPDPEDLYEE